MELAASHLLYQTSPPDRLDTSPVFKCGINYDAALDLARDLGIALNDLLWDPV
jgi:origin recognition complex subunit 5